MFAVTALVSPLTLVTVAVGGRVGVAGASSGANRIAELDHPVADPIPATQTLDARRPLGPLQGRLLRAATAAGLPHVHPHALRHMAGSFAIADGASIFDVADMLGHVNATMILTRYGHSLPGGRERAVAGVAAAVGAW